MSHRAGAGGGAGSGVHGLVQSIKQHKNFKQLAAYSVQCLLRAMTPPAQGWEKAAAAAVEAGAIDAIAAVISSHEGDGAVLSSATACLAALAHNPEYARKLTESGAWPRVPGARRRAVAAAAARRPGAHRASPPRRRHRFTQA